MPNKNKSITRSDTFDKEFAELEEISERASKSDMPNEKIKEIASKVVIIESKEEWYNGSSEDCTMADLPKCTRAMQEYGEFVRQQTLDEVIASVPEEKFCQTQPMVTDYANINNALLVEGVMKWNDCRQKTLSNLQALKDNK